MTLLQRNLKMTTERGDFDVPIKLYMPIEEKDHWRCNYEIGWPTGIQKSFAGGVDAIQSLLLALQKIAADLYTSYAHRSGKLIWLQRGQGYGFPLPRGIRDLYEGDDQSL